MKRFRMRRMTAFLLTVIMLTGTMCSPVPGQEIDTALEETVTEETATEEISPEPSSDEVYEVSEGNLPSDTEEENGIPVEEVPAENEEEEPEAAGEDTFVPNDYARENENWSVGSDGVWTIKESDLRVIWEMPAFSSSDEYILLRVYKGSNPDLMIPNRIRVTDLSGGLDDRVLPVYLRYKDSTCTPILSDKSKEKVETFAVQGGVKLADGGCGLEQMFA